MSRLKDERDLLSKPGDLILEILEHTKMSQAELAERMGKTAPKVNDIISGKEPITIATAFLLEKVLGVDAQMWLNREALYREKLTRLEQEEILEECKDWLKQQPIKELKKSGHIKSEKIGPAMADECLKFYGVASPVQWKSIYVDQYVSSSFRKSEAHQNTLGALAAWLRMGEIQMKKLNLKEYNKELFKESLNEIRKLVRQHPDNFATLLQEYCLTAGVAVIYTMCISKAPVSGVARWIGGNPLIQLTDRYKSNDHFWFTFFHEVAHILLHGKKDVFIEDLKEAETNPEKEAEADEFATKFLIPADLQKELPEVITEKDIRMIARKYDTHAAIVLGRLQHLKILPYHFAPELKLKVVLDPEIDSQSDL